LQAIPATAAQSMLCETPLPPPAEHSQRSNRLRAADRKRKSGCGGPLGFIAPDDATQGASLAGAQGQDDRQNALEAGNFAEERNAAAGTSELP
ncbi:MAG TPA: hypothetical protein VEC06_05395, partial [Paucimonas sp.]|nr:hypothetical protein [Paucimonas sp.]